MDVTVAHPILMMREPWETLRSAYFISSSAPRVDEIIYVKSSFVHDFINGVQNVVQLKLDEICMYENNPFMNDCANICEDIFCE
jgi:hypothetical protein